MPTNRIKPSFPRLNRAHPTAAGVSLCLPLHEPEGTLAGGTQPGRSIDISGNGYHGADTNSLPRLAGPYGAQISAFGGGSYLRVDPPQQLLGLVYPFWSAVLYTAAPSGDSPLFCQSLTTNTGRYLILRLNIGGTSGRVDYQVGGVVAGFAVTATGTSSNDGKPHVVMGVSYSATSHHLFFDGLDVASSATNPGALSGDRLSVGAMPPITATGSTVPIAFVAAGSGSVPDPAALAGDWLAGRFSMARPRRSWAPLLAALDSVGPPTLVAGTAAFDSGGPGLGPGLKLTAAAPTGGTAPYTYQWQRSTTSGTSGFANLSNGGGVSGATTTTLVDGSAAIGTLYWYRLVCADSSSTQQFANSNAVSAQVYTGGTLSTGGLILPIGFNGGFGD